MSTERIERLDDKIVQVSKLVQKLKEENALLKSRIKELEKSLAQSGGILVASEGLEGLEKGDNSMVALKKDFNLLQRENFEMKQDRESIETGIEEILSQISDLLA